MNILTPSLLEKDLLPGVRLAKHGVLFYFLGAFGIAWLCLGLAILAGRGIIALPFSLFVTLGTLGPLLSAIAMTAHEAGGQVYAPCWLRRCAGACAPVGTL